MTNPQPSQNVAGQPAKAAGEYKPLTTFTIAAANVTQRPLRSLLLGLIAAVFTFLLFSSAMVTANLEAGISSLAARMGADVLVVPQGQGKKIQSVILRAEPSTFYLDGKLLDVVQKLPGVAKASGQLFISSLDAQCCSVKVQLIGIDEATDFVIAPWLKHAADKPLSGNDVIVGDYIYGEIGSTLKFFDQEYRIVGRLAPTGMGFDSSIFMTLDAARRAGRAASPDRADEMAQSLSAILVRVNPGVDPITVSDELLDQLGLKANVNFVFASNMMSDTSAKLQKVVSVMYTAAGGFWAAAAIIMLIVYFLPSASVSGSLRHCGPWVPPAAKWSALCSRKLSLFQCWDPPSALVSRRWWYRIFRRSSLMRSDCLILLRRPAAGCGRWQRA